MSWLSQNWIWIVVVIAIAWFLMTRGRHVHTGHMGGHGAADLLGMGHGGHGSGGAEQPQQPTPGPDAPSTR